MVAAADDDGVVALVYEAAERMMSHVYERTGSLDDLVAERLHALERAIGGPVRGDQHGAGGGVGRLPDHADAVFPEAIEDRLVVDEIAENRERSRLGAPERERNRVAHAEAHPERSRAEHAHPLGSGLGGVRHQGVGGGD
jgi:hypothetical protein